MLTLLFGRYRRKPLADVPTEYLAWMLGACKVSSGLRAALAMELAARGQTPPAALAPRRLSTCPCCGPETVACSWMTDRLGRRHVRADCRWCGCGLMLLPSLASYSQMADAAYQDVGQEANR
jgi:hypothetical protein